MEPARPAISVLIVNFNGRAHLKECLESLRAQSFRDFETVVVENASSDGSADYLRETFPEARVVAAPANLGFAGGNNFGFPHCRGDLVFLLNNDTRLAADTLAKLAEAARERPDVGVFQCFLINFRDESLSDSGGDAVYSNGCISNLGGYPVGLFTERRPLASACAAAALFRRGLLDRLGGFDEDFFLNFEDLDLCFRARHLGETILFLPEARVYHKGSATLGGKRSRLALFHAERNHLWFLVKNFPLATLLKAAPAIALLKIFRIFVTASRGQLGTYLRANWRSLLGMPRMLGKRRGILGQSRLSRREFEAMLRRGWLRERLAARLGSARLRP